MTFPCSEYYRLGLSAKCCICINTFFLRTIFLVPSLFVIIIITIVKGRFKFFQLIQDGGVGFNAESSAPYQLKSSSLKASNPGTALNRCLLTNIQRNFKLSLSTIGKRFGVRIVSSHRPSRYTTSEYRTADFRRR